MCPWFKFFIEGHTRQGLKCKLCRMNVHPDCQDGVPKCQPKSRLLRRQKSASEIDSRIVGNVEDDSKCIKYFKELLTVFEKSLQKVMFSPARTFVQRLFVQRLFASETIWARNFLRDFVFQGFFAPIFFCSKEFIPGIFSPRRLKMF